MPLPTTLCHHCRKAKPLPTKWCGMRLCRVCKRECVAVCKRAAAVLKPGPVPRHMGYRQPRVLTVHQGG